MRGRVRNREGGGTPNMLDRRWCSTQGAPCRHGQSVVVCWGMTSIRIAIALGIGAQLSCVPTAPPAGSLPAGQSDTARVEFLAPVTDLSGSWATGSSNEPPSGPVVQHPSCANNPAVWIIRQTGNTLETWAFPESFNQGIKSADPGPQRVAGSVGTISGADVRIVDGESRFVLRYDAETGHLRGTRNGVAFWAARQHIVRGEACPGFP